MEELQTMGTSTAVAAPLDQESFVRIFQEAAREASARHFIDPENKIGDPDESFEEETWDVLDN